MAVNYGGRLGHILRIYKNVHCPMCKTPQVQIINYTKGDPKWKCRHCKQVFSMPFTDPKPLKDRDDIPSEVVELMKWDEYSLLKAWRVHLGITQLEIAARIGNASATSLTVLERKNTRDIKEVTRIKLAKALNIKPSQLDELHHAKAS
nr:helix-turn-helix transcriptional regulator [uncultured Vibrio sp.]